MKLLFFHTFYAENLLFCYWLVVYLIGLFFRSLHNLVDHTDRNSILQDYFQFYYFVAEAFIPFAFKVFSNLFIPVLFALQYALIFDFRHTRLILVVYSFFNSL